MVKIIVNGDKKTFRVEYYSEGIHTSTAEFVCRFLPLETASDRIQIVSNEYNITLSFLVSELEINGDVPTDAADAFAKLQFVSFSLAGGTAITTFEPNTYYKADDPVVHEGALWRAKVDFLAGNDFDPADWDKLSISVEEFNDELDEKLDKTEDPDQIYGTDKDGKQTTFDKSDFEVVGNKTDEIEDASEASDIDYPTEKAVRTELDKKVDKTDSKGKVYGTDGDGEQTTYGLSDFEFVENKVKEIRDITKATDVDYPTEKAVRTGLDATVTAFNTALEPISAEIQGLHGKTARLNGYDFGMSITSDNINDSDIQTILTAYALVQLGLSDAADIPNFIAVHNLYAGDGGDHLLVFNEANVGSGTPENPEFPAHWVDNGLDSVSVASNTSLGVVKGSETDMQVSVGLDGKMSVNGLSTALGNKEDSANKTTAIRDESEADNTRYPTEKAIRTELDKKVDKTDDENQVYGTDENGEQTTYGVNSFGKVDTVNGISPDTDKNVKTDYVYETEAAFEADKDNIPIGATVIKLYEYPDNIAVFVPFPDYVKIEKVNRISANNGTWTADRTGYAVCRAVASQAAVAGAGAVTQGDIAILVNNVVVEATGGHSVVATNSGYGVYRTATVAITKGDTVKISLAGTNITLSEISCYYVPLKFIRFDYNGNEIN
jgi:hypothetical protein